MSPENLRAWQIYELLNSQFVYDFHLAPFILQTAGITCTSDEWAMLYKKFDIIHQLIKKHHKDNPPQEGAD